MPGRVGMAACVALVLAAVPVRAGELLALEMEPGQSLIDAAAGRWEAGAGADGGAAFRVDAAAPVRVRLLVTEAVDVEAALLVYGAALRSENLQGAAWLEMWCEFEGLGAYFSRALDRPVTGTSGWLRAEAAFRLLAGQNPDRVRLNLVIDGTGTVWIDRLTLERRPLP